MTTKDPQSVPVIKVGFLKRFKKGFLSKNFKYVYVELLADSHLLWFRNQSSSKPDGFVLLKDVCDYLAVGPYTRSIPSRPGLPRGTSERHILAVPLQPCPQTHVQWFMFSNDNDLNDWMTKISSTLPPLPPPSCPPGDTTHLSKPPPPYQREDLVDGAQHYSTENSSDGKKVSTSETHGFAGRHGDEAVNIAATTACLWGWSWGWGGGWGCDGWGCFDYGPLPISAADAAGFAVATGCENGTDGGFYGCQHGADHIDDAIGGYDAGDGGCGAVDCGGGLDAGGGFDVCDVGGFDVGGCFDIAF